MPPRYAYWTILIDQKPTAFRAREREELLPTFAQLRRTNPDVVMKWFARGRLWDNPEQAQWAGKNAQQGREKRTGDWRPGGKHEDPRARFEKKHRDTRGPRPPRPDTPSASGAPGAPPEKRAPWRPAGGGGAKPAWRDRPAPGASSEKRGPWRPPAAGGGAKPAWRDRPAPGASSEKRGPWRPPAAGGGAKPAWRDRPAPGASSEKRGPWKPEGGRSDGPRRWPRAPGRPKPPGRKDS